MAKSNGNGDAPATVELTKADAAKLVKGKVVVPVVEKGEPAMIRPKEGGSHFKTEELPIKAEHVLSHRIDGNEVVVVTVDGQKLRAPLA